MQRCIVANNGAGLIQHRDGVVVLPHEELMDSLPNQGHIKLLLQPSPSPGTLSLICLEFRASSPLQTLTDVSFRFANVIPGVFAYALSTSLRLRLLFATRVASS